MVILSVFFVTLFKVSGGLIQAELLNLLPTFIKIVKTIEAGPLGLRGGGVGSNTRDGCNDTNYKAQIFCHFQLITICLE